MHVIKTCVILSSIGVWNTFVCRVVVKYTRDMSQYMSSGTKYYLKTTSVALCKEKLPLQLYFSVYLFDMVHKMCIFMLS